MQQTNIFPNMVIQMAAIGEEAGSLDEMLIKVAEAYEEEVSNAVDALSSLLEPIIIVFVGVVVGTMVIAMYLPIFKMAVLPAAMPPVRTTTNVLESAIIQANYCCGSAENTRVGVIGDDLLTPDQGNPPGSRNKGSERHGFAALHFSYANQGQSNQCTDDG